MFISKTDMIAWITYASRSQCLRFIRYRRLQAIVIVEITKSQCPIDLQNTKYKMVRL